MAQYLLDQGCAVTGVDAAPEMIEIARQALPDGNWVVSDMRGLELGARFDGILAWDSFFHLTPGDQRDLFAIFARHAAAGAALIFTSGPSHGETIGEMEGDPLYHASLDAQEYRALLEAHGFGVIEHVVEDPDCGGHTIWLAKMANPERTHGL